MEEDLEPHQTRFLSHRSNTPLSTLPAVLCSTLQFQSLRARAFTLASADKINRVSLALDLERARHSSSTAAVTEWARVPSRAPGKGRGLLFLGALHAWGNG